jgi:hypothetical protein
MFSAPATGGGDKLPVSEVNNHYVLIYVKSFDQDVPTAHGPADAVRVNVADLTTGTHHLDVLWFPKVIVGSLRNQVGSMVLAKVAQGVPQPGKSAPWVLEDATQITEVVAAANKWVEANPGVLDGKPVAVAPAPASTGLAGNLI